MTHLPLYLWLKLQWQYYCHEDILVSVCSNDATLLTTLHASSPCRDDRKVVRGLGKILIMTLSKAVVTVVSTFRVSINCK